MNLPWYKRDPEAFVTGVAGMSAEEVGVYQLLLDYQWIRGGRLPTDEDELLELLPRSVTPERLTEMLAGKLGQKFDRDDDGLFNRRLDREMEAAQESAAKRKRAAEKAASARWNGNAERMPNACEGQSDGNAEGMPRASSSSSVSTSESLSDEKKRLTEHVSDWNDLADRIGKPAVDLDRRSSESIREMRSKLTNRSKEPGWDWPAIVTELGRLNDFALEGQWLTFDWLLKNSKNYMKLLEGQYRRKKPRDRERAMSREREEAAGW